MNLDTALEKAIAIEYKGQLLHVLDFDRCEDEDIEPFVTVIPRTSLPSFSDTFALDLSELDEDPMLKVFSHIQIYPRGLPSET